MDLSESNSLDYYFNYRTIELNVSLGVGLFSGVAVTGNAPCICRMHTGVGRQGGGTGGMQPPTVM